MSRSRRSRGVSCCVRSSGAEGDRFHDAGEEADFEEWLAKPRGDGAHDACGGSARVSDRDESREYVRIADKAIEELGSAYRELRATRYPDQRQADVTFAVARMVALGIRQLKAARSDMEAGYEPESVVHIRAALDAMLDIAFLLSHVGEARWRLARKYHAMSLLRLPTIRKEMEANPARFSEAKREEWRAAHREFGLEKGTDHRDHW